MGMNPVFQLAGFTSSLHAVTPQPAKPHPLSPMTTHSADSIFDLQPTITTFDSSTATGDSSRGRPFLLSAWRKSKCQESQDHQTQSPRLTSSADRKSLDCGDSIAQTAQDSRPHSYGIFGTSAHVVRKPCRRNNYYVSVYQHKRGLRVPVPMACDA